MATEITDPVEMVSTAKPNEQPPIANVESTALEVLDNSFYIYHKHKIVGPITQHEIITLYVSSKIRDKIWIKSVKDAQKDGNWYLLNMSETSTNDDNKEIMQQYPALYNYLSPAIQSKDFEQHDIPTDIPEAAGSISRTKQIIQLLGRIVTVLCTIIVTAHILPTMSVTFCFGFCVYCLVEGDQNKEYLLFGICVFTAFLGQLITPIFIVYYVLLNVVNNAQWENEGLQSWMIAYIAWGVFSYLFTVGVAIARALQVQLEDKIKVDGLLQIMFFIIGVDFAQIGLESLFINVIFGLVILFLFPSLAALLPSAVIGFIANFMLEEKFQLKCGDSIANDIDELCFDTDYGCCEVISSHNIRNTYEFVGGLASNILATWAGIRIIGYLMVNITPDIAMFVRRNK
eukprot:448121_1